MDTTTHRMKIRRATKVNGALVLPGDVVEVGTIDHDTLLHFGKAEDFAGDDGPTADHREKEHEKKVTKRRAHRAAPKKKKDDD
jgi:hypothetical protein